jgi:hypothetical protein
MVIDFKTIHFPITYGTLYCPNNNKNKKEYIQLNELADDDFSNILIMFENENIDINIFMNCVAQCFISLLTFYKKTNLQHNDAHLGNFLYHKIKDEGYYHYNIDNKDYYLKNKGYIMVIWDFGFSDLFKPNKHIYTDFTKFLTMKTFLTKDDIYIKNLKELENDFYKKLTINSSIDDMKKMIIDFMLKNVSTFITERPSNIINKKPFII